MSPPRKLRHGEAKQGEQLFFFCRRQFGNKLSEPTPSRLPETRHHAAWERLAGKSVGLSRPFPARRGGRVARPRAERAGWPHFSPRGRAPQPRFSARSPRGVAFGRRKRRSATLAARSYLFIFKPGGAPHAFPLQT